MTRDDIEVGILTHVGMVRSENQDFYGLWEPDDETEFLAKGRLLVVCDGMGGHNGGTVASRTAVDALIKAYGQSAIHHLGRLITTSIEHANQAVRRRGAGDPGLRNMGTTCVALAVRGRVAEVAHVGDSRAYLVRDGAISQITRDHTYLNDLIDIGLLTPEKARNHPERNIITRCVGMGETLEVDAAAIEARADDFFVLCSDGLYNHVNDDEILRLVIEKEPQGACQALVDLANSRGGEDNITVAVLKVRSVPEPSPDDEIEEAEEDDDSHVKTPVLVIDDEPPVSPKKSSGVDRVLGTLVLVELMIAVILEVLIAGY